MNERIRELAKQTGAKELGADLYGGEFIGAIRLDFLEKFAELIVQKCVSIVALHGITNFENENISWVCENVVKEVKEHFGVK